MQMLRRLRFKKKPKKRLQQKVEDLRQENFILRRSLASMSSEAFDERRVIGGSVNPFEISVPAFCMSDVPSVTAETPISSSDTDSSLTSSLSSMQPHDVLPRFDEARAMPSFRSSTSITTEARQDSLSLSREHFVGSEEELSSTSFVRQHPPLFDESFANDTMTGATSFRKKQSRNALNCKSHTFQLRPKSIVHKWNRYADMEDDGYEVAPRHRTKLAKALQKRVTATIVDSRDGVPAATETSNNVVNLHIIAKTNSFAGIVDDDGATRDAPPDEATELIVRPAETAEDAGEIPGQDYSMAHGTPDVDGLNVNSRRKYMEETMDTDATRGVSDEGTVANVATFDVETDHCLSVRTNSEIGSTNETVESVTPGPNNLQQDVVKLSLAQILIQSYQADPANPGYWVRKSRRPEGNDGCEPAVKHCSTFSDKHMQNPDPKPTLNSFLAEVKTRRSEIMGKATCTVDRADFNDVQRPQNHGSEGRKRVGIGTSKNVDPPMKHSRRQEYKTRTVSANDLLAELKAKQEQRRGACQPWKMRFSSSSEAKPRVGHGPSILEELKLKQKERLGRQKEDEHFQEKESSEEACTMISI